MSLTAVTHLEKELWMLKVRFSQEYSMSIAEFIGVLECFKLEVFRDQIEDLKDEDDLTTIWRQIGGLERKAWGMRVYGGT